MLQVAGGSAAGQDIAFDGGQVGPGRHRAVPLHHQQAAGAGLDLDAVGPSGDGGLNQLQPVEIPVGQSRARQLATALLNVDGDFSVGVELAFVAHLREQAVEGRRRHFFFRIELLPVFEEVVKVIHRRRFDAFAGPPRRLLGMRSWRAR